MLVKAKEDWKTGLQNIKAMWGIKTSQKPQANISTAEATAFMTCKSPSLSMSKMLMKFSEKLEKKCTSTYSIQNWKEWTKSLETFANCKFFLKTTLTSTSSFIMKLIKSKFFIFGILTHLHWCCVSWQVTWSGYYKNNEIYCDLN